MVMKLDLLFILLLNWNRRLLSCYHLLQNNARCTKSTQKSCPINIPMPLYVIIFLKVASCLFTSGFRPGRIQKALLLVMDLEC